MLSFNHKISSYKKYFFIFFLCLLPLNLSALTLQDLNHQPVSFEGLLNRTEKPTILHFFASWCKKCMAELPDYQDFLQSDVANQFQTLSIALDPKPLSKGVTYFDTSFALMNHYKLKGVPSTLILSPTGKVLYSRQGALNWRQPHFLTPFIKEDK